jgi:GT2 family glycosyltransferase
MNKLVSIIIPTRNRCELLDACLRSIYQSTYEKFEVIVLDNASSDHTRTMVKNQYPSVRLIELSNNSFVAASRNLGIKYARGEYLLFIDDDNIIHQQMVEELINIFHSDPRIGMAGPKMYYRNSKNVIWWAGASINLLTSRTIYRGLNETDQGQYDQVSATEHIPNVFMVKKEVVGDIGEFSEEYKMSYSESDYAMRAGAAGYKIMYCPKAVAYHDIALPHKYNRPFKLPMRAYYFARNRVIYMKKFSPRMNFIFFMMGFYPVFTFGYLAKLVFSRDIPGCRMYLRGARDGLIYGVRGELRNYYSRSRN